MKPIGKVLQSSVLPCLIAVGIWTYLGLMIFFITYSDRFWRLLDYIFSPSDGPSGMGELGMAILCFDIFMAILCFDIFMYRRAFFRSFYWLVFNKTVKNLFLPLMVLLTGVLGCSQAQKQPEWQKARVFAENQDHPSALMTDEEFLYFVTGGTLASLNNRTSGVWKILLTGGEPIQLFKGFRENENSAVIPSTFVLCLDEKYVYWSAGGSIWRTPKDGGESESLTNGTPTVIAVDESKIYWHNFGGENSPPTPIYVAEKTGSQAKALTEPVKASGIVADRDFVYWAQANGIYKIQKTGAEKSRIYSAPEKENIFGLIADKENFYFTQGNSTKALYKLAKNGGEAKLIAPNINSAKKFFADETDIYFVTNEDSFKTSLVKISKNGGEIIKLDNGYLADFVVGKNKIYIATVNKVLALDK